MSGPVLILAGGTGGHIFPGLAVARALAAQSVAVEWLGAEGAMETRLVPAAGIALHILPVRGLRGGGWVRRLTAPFMLLRAVFGAMRLLRRLQPRCVLSFGGFAAGPGGLAAWLLRRPLLLHESNRAPGLTNRLLARFARRRLVGMPGTFAREEVVGNPVRAEIAGLPAPAQRERAPGPLRLLVVGGSQGARALNQHLPEALRLSGVCCEIRHQTGATALDATAQRYREAGLRADTVAFIEDMPTAYRWADLVVCRAGASTLAELCAVGLPAVLVPLPTAADDHQSRNADWLVEAGAALKLSEGEGFVQRLAGALAQLATDPARAAAMAEAARRLARVDAAERVAAICIEESCA
ncbi:MAG: undecaprenyldiphospho-muramoylpentapeptide beta-N-acetylglucosaminyltransferase [Xanthomonadales bacterium]|nr:undecaprenyldiphospho-muramoylpentapeptide beta-N-acetylglucosaminyltransferase [Xanthomonadales bacterium]